MGWILLAIAVIDIIVEFMTANAIISNVEEEAGVSVNLSAGDFISTGVFLSLAFAVVLAILIMVGDKGNLGARKAAGVLAVLTAVGGLLSIIGVLSTSSEAADLEALSGIDVLPGYYVPVALILCVVQIGLSALAAVKLLKK